MTTDTKVADLPKAWRATSKAAGSTPVAVTFNVCADELDAAISRQDAQAIPEGLEDRIEAAIKRIVDGHAPRRIPADPTDVDLVLAEVLMLIQGNWPPFWIAAPEQRAAQAEQQGAGSAIDAVISSALALIRGSEEFETADGLVNAAQLHLWHALEDAIERVGPAEVISHANRQPVGQDAAYEMGAKGAPATEAERLLFEAWMRGHCWALSATWDGKTYLSDEEQGGMLCPRAMTTRRLWAAWRDRAALTAPPAQAVDLLEVNELLRIWQTHFDSGVRPDDDEPEDVALWDRIAAVRTAIDKHAGKGAR